MCRSDSFKSELASYLKETDRGRIRVHPNGYVEFLETQVQYQISDLCKCNCSPKNNEQNSFFVTLFSDIYEFEKDEILQWIDEGKEYDVLAHYVLRMLDELLDVCIEEKSSLSIWLETDATSRVLTVYTCLDNDVCIQLIGVSICEDYEQ